MMEQDNDKIAPSITVSTQEKNDSMNLVQGLKMATHFPLLANMTDGYFFTKESFHSLLFFLIPESTY